MAGKHGIYDESKDIYHKDSIQLWDSIIDGVVGDANIERAIAYTYTAGPSPYLIQIITDKGLSGKFKMHYRGLGESIREPSDPPLSDALEAWSKGVRYFEATCIVEGQPLGFRFFDMKKGDAAPPFAEWKYEDPGETPSITVQEESNNRIEWKISPCFSSCDHRMSFDGGKTWEPMSLFYSCNNYYDFMPDELAKNMHPMIKFVAYNRLRRYVKYYTFGKGMHDDPNLPLPSKSTSKPSTPLKPSSYKEDSAIKTAKTKN